MTADASGHAGHAAGRVLSTAGVAPVTLEQLNDGLAFMHRRISTHGWSQYAQAIGAAAFAEQLGLITHAEFVETTARLGRCPGHHAGQGTCGYGCTVVRT